MASLLATQSSQILETALQSSTGRKFRVHAAEHIASPAAYTKQILNRFRTEFSPAYDALKIEIISNDEIWILSRR